MARGRASRERASRERASDWLTGSGGGRLGKACARMQCFPHLDSPSREPALASLKQTSGRGPKTREAQRPSSTYGTSLVFSPFGPPAARMPCFPRLDRPSVLVLAASSAVLRPLWALLDRSGVVLGPRRRGAVGCGSGTGFGRPTAAGSRSLRSTSRGLTFAVQNKAGQK